MSFVYVISAGPWRQKIGISNNVPRRLKGLQTAHADALAIVGSVETSGPTLAERYAHFMLRDRQLIGEWFDVSPAHALEIVRKAARMVAWGQRPSEEPGEYVQDGIYVADLDSPIPSPAPFGLAMGASGAMKRREINADACRRLLRRRGG